MAQLDDGLTNAERNSIKWINVRDRFLKTDDGCKCPSCEMIRMMLSTERERERLEARSGTDAERRARRGRG